MFAESRPNLAHKVRYRHKWPEPDKYMDVVRYAVNRQPFVLLPSHNSRDIFLHFLPAILLNQALSCFRRKDGVDIDLTVRVGHG
jgi:hypothetical protein